MTKPIWSDPCPHGGPEHCFVRYSGKATMTGPTGWPEPIIAFCEECGALR